MLPVSQESPDSPAPQPSVWIFGAAPLPQTRRLAPLLRRAAELAISMETPDPAVDRLIDDLQRAVDDLSARAPADLTPRLGLQSREDQRVYVDHGHHVGAYNPCFPDYEITVEGTKAWGEVTFPLAFEGPPGLVHGGVIATFFDCVIQQHNCAVGQAGKTVTLQLRFRRPTPLGVPLRFEIERTVEDRRIHSTVTLLHGDEAVSIATVEAVAGNLANLPAVSPRRWSQ